MNTKSHPWRFGMLPLVDRIRWSTGLRGGIAVVVAMLWIGLPGERRTDGRGLLAVAIAFVAAAALTLAAPLVGRRTAILAVNIGLLVDGIGLAFALHAYGGVTGAVSVLMVLHVCAVSLLTSFRSGSKVAVWHALLVLCVLQAERVDLLSAVGSSAFPFAGYVTFVLLLGAASLATSAFAALNERELRRRRYDAEVLRSLAAQLETAADFHQIAAALARMAVDDLLAARALFVLQRTANDEDGQGLQSFEASWPLLQLSTEVPPTSFPHGSIFSGATDAPVLAHGVDKLRDPYLAARLPGALHLAVVPVPLGPAGRGWLVVDMGARKRVENRLMTTLMQAVAHTGLALSRAVLVERLRLAAETDGLTGVSNRKSFDLAMRRELAQAQRNGDGLAVMLVDLDFFKRVNDTYGHQVGDEVLRAASTALREQARAGDVVARYGGEEFAVILPGVDPATAWETAERFRAAVHASSAPVPVTCSIGIACRPAGDVPVTTLLEAADRALYRAKDGGRNRAEVGLVQEGLVCS